MFITAYNNKHHSYILYIRNLEQKTLARSIYEEQKIKKWPGLASETQKICEDLKIEDCNLTNLGKQEFKKIAIAACKQKYKDDLQLLAKGKCERINYEVYGKKEYTHKKNINDVRKTYRTRFGLKPFAGNYSHRRRFFNTAWLCKCQEEREKEAHIMSGQCKVYGDLAKKFTDLTAYKVFLLYVSIAL